MTAIRTAIVPCAEVDEAVDEDEQILAAATDLPSRLAATQNLAISLQSRFQCRRDLSDLDRAIDVIRGTDGDLDTAGPVRIVIDAQLMSCLIATSRLEDAREAREIGARLLRAAGPVGEVRAGAAAMLGMAAMICFRHTSDPTDAEEFVDLLEEAVGGVADGSPSQLVVQGALLAALTIRYRFSPARERDLDRAVEVFDQLDPVTAGGDPEGVVQFACGALVDALIDRHERRHDPADLRTAQRIRDSMPSHSQGFVQESPAAWDPQAFRHYSSFRQTQDPEFLNQAIHAQERAMNEPNRTDRQRASFAYMLAICRFTRFMAHRGRGHDDLNRAVELLRDARRDWRDTILVHSSAQLLARFLVQRYMALGRPADLREARVVLESALRTGPVERHAKTSILIMIAYCDSARAERDGDDEAAERAMDRFEELTELMPEGSMEAVAVQTTLAGVLQAKATTTRLPEDTARAYRASRAACSHAGSSPLATVPCAEGWGHLGWRREDYAEAAQAYGHAVAGLQTIAVLYPRREDKQDWLGRAGSMAARAAFALARLGRAEQAVEVLEAGRAVLLSEALDRQHVDLDRLSAAGHGALRDRYERAAARGAKAERMFEPDYDNEYVPTIDPTGQDPGAPLRELSDELGDAREQLRRVVDEIRSVPGYETFLLPPSFADVQGVVRAARVPLVYLAATPRGGLALVVTASRHTAVEVVWLPELTIAHERTWVGRCVLAAEDGDFDAYDEASRWLGRAVMGPVMKLLAPYRRAVLVPDGLLGSAPLHAVTLPATDGGGGSYALDRLTLGYAPSARALGAHQGAARPDRSGELLLAVADPASAGQRALPGAQIETDIIARHFGPDAQVLRGGEATRARVLSILAASDVLHFACHATARPMDPLGSHLQLAGGQLITLRDIGGLDGLNPRLTVLSACQTAVIGDDLPDELVSLATGLLQAGSTGVVATQWSVDDVASSALMARFYQLWRDEGVDADHALRRAQLWVRRTTNGEKVREFPDLLRIPRYAPAAGAPAASRHAWESRRSHEHPVYWAAFTFLGRP
ncbi:CHAT domain-containing protein [Frankia tisae]|uniref:CHAT domain-containing protein n=1 Tax=Frankia tisae TaxID=2950104 RepID=UPI0021BF0A5C|nr:CHAT domain-containing protein [Frankia tisae]